MTIQVSITDSAAKQIAKLIAKEPNPDSKLRVSIEGGGCSGFKYNFDFVTSQEPDDLVLQKEGAIVLIDPISLELMKDSIIDFTETLAEAKFEIKNPNSSARCGCGNSFSI
ncbi:MAG: iron-sulfur cluster insertion protein ErpA [Sphingobacteriia bacterium]|nr:iron-sulfur cluster insertion protein ErpA [Sphingobacteriia bacterium]